MFCCRNLFIDSHMYAGYRHDRWGEQTTNNTATLQLNRQVAPADSPSAEVMQPKQGTIATTMTKLNQPTAMMHQLNLNTLNMRLFL